MKFGTVLIYEDGRAYYIDKNGKMHSSLSLKTFLSMVENFKVREAEIVKDDHVNENYILLTLIEE